MFPTVEKSIKKPCLIFIFCAYFVYLISIAKEMTYSAQMVEMISSLDSSKSAVGLGLTIFYIVYSLSQILVASVMKKIDVRKFMTVTISLSALSYMLVPAMNALWQLWVLLAVNGFLQSGIWGGVMYFLGKHIPKEMSGFVAKLTSTGIAVGTALTYGFSALFVAVANWKITFLFFGVLTAASLVLFLISERSLSKKLSAQPPASDVEKEAETQISPEKPLFSGEKTQKKGLAATVVYLTVLCFFACCVYYAISNWVPNLLSEVYGMPNRYSILLTIFIPLGALPGPIVTTSFVEKRRGGVNAVCLIFSGVALLFSAALCLWYGANIVLAILFSVLILMTMRGVGHLLAGYMPLLLNDRIDSGTLTLIVNAGACAGAAFMPYLTGLVLDGSGANGWLYYYLFVAALALVTGAIALFGRIRDKRKKSFFNAFESTKKSM